MFGAIAFVGTTSLLFPLDATPRQRCPPPRQRCAPVDRQTLLQAVAVGLFSVPLAANAEEQFSGAYAKMSAPGGRPEGLGSAGISAYEKLKIEKAVADLAEGMSAANDPKLLPTLDYFSKLFAAVKESELQRVDAGSVEKAAGNIAALASGNERFESQAASIGKRTAALSAAAKKGDEGAAATAAIKLADELADFAFGWCVPTRTPPMTNHTLELSCAHAFTLSPPQGQL